MNGLLKIRPPRLCISATTDKSVGTGELFGAQKKGGRAKIVFSSRLQAVTDASRGRDTPPKSVISFGRPPSVDTLAMQRGHVGAKTRLVASFLFGTRLSRYKKT
jgi:hypothetical protein